MGLRKIFKKSVAFFKSEERLPELVFYNSLSSSLERFTKKGDEPLKIYSCGPTVYEVPHIGNLRYFVFVDLLHRVLKRAGFKLKHVINITDVGHLSDDADYGKDKMEESARKKKKSAKEIADEISEIFFSDLEKLGFEIGEYSFPRATEYISEQILMIETLQEKGYTYKTSDGIYFDSSLFPEYGKLGKIDKTGLKEGARIGKNDEKKNPSDFALWKFSKPGEKRQQEWNSPWGKGFPGWHIECSAMIRALLGRSIDIHTGGIDHKQLHHNNEIAQSECASGKILARFWLHSNFLNLKNEKMSKSLNNVILLKDLTDKGFDPMHFRYYLLGTHYRKEIKFSFEALEAARSAYEKIAEFLRDKNKDLKSALSRLAQEYEMEILRHAFDDLSFPEALAALWKALKDERLSDNEKARLVFEFEKLSGVDFSRKPESRELDLDSLDEELQNMIKEREKARKTGDYASADKLRDEIEKRGYRLQDRSSGKVKIFKI